MDAPWALTHHLDFILLYFILVWIFLVGMTFFEKLFSHRVLKLLRPSHGRLRLSHAPAGISSHAALPRLTARAMVLCRHVHTIEQVNRFLGKDAMR